MNTIFLFSRDSTIIMNIVDDPMVLFSGVRIPLKAFPLWANVVSLFFPITYCLKLVRVVINENSLDNYTLDLLALSICLFIMVALTLFLLKLAERNNRETGNISFY